MRRRDASRPITFLSRRRLFAVEWSLNPLIRIRAVNQKISFDNTSNLVANERKSMSEDNPDSQMIAEITEALAANRRIEAIKIYCDAKGARLVEGKEFIDRLMPRLAEEDPELIVP